MKLKEAIKELRNESNKKKFIQSFDLIVTLKNFDAKKPETKIQTEVVLPNPHTENITVGIISDQHDNGITTADIEQIANNKSEIKKMTKQYDYFLCEPPLMVLVGKVLGRYLGPKGKMPKLLPPGQDPTNIIEDLKKSVRIKTGVNASIQTIIGKESMDDDKIQENVEKVLDEIKKVLPKGESQIKNILLKLTMSKPITIE